MADVILITGRETQMRTSSPIRPIMARMAMIAVIIAV